MLLTTSGACSCRTQNSPHQRHYETTWYWRFLWELQIDPHSNDTQDTEAATTTNLAKYAKTIRTCDK